MTEETVDVFSFMALRSCERLEPGATRAKFIQDDAYHLRTIDFGVRSHMIERSEADNLPSGVVEVDLFSPNSISLVGKRLFAAVQVERPAAEIVSGVESMLLGGFEYAIGDGLRLAPIVHGVDLGQNLSAIDAMRLGKLNGRLHYRVGNSLRILPDSMDDIEAPLAALLARAASRISLRLATGKPTDALDLTTLLEDLRATFDVPADPCPVTDFVFDRANGRYALPFALTKRVYFDALYALYVLRKREKVNLEPAIAALRGLHVVEQLAIGQYFATLESEGGASAFASGSANLRTTLLGVYPRLEGWTPGQPDFSLRMREADIPLPATLAELRTLFQATPVVNPLFARFPTRFLPFNSITPVGIGDLKVVKQKFLGYRKGEIAHIETVLAGETKTRVHRALEKTEDSVSLSSENSNEVSKDNQSTDRYELKRESENVIKTDIGVNANASVTYDNKMVVASVSAGFSFANSRADTARVSANLVNEVVAKATSRIVSRTSEQRSRTTIFETEETSTHGFTNPAGNGNISGIYRWLDKVYEGRIHNFGKRMMFEFIVPEPSAFFVSSRLKAYAASLNLPDFPKVVDEKQPAPQLPVRNASEITEEIWETVLKARYNVGDLVPPAPSVDVPVSMASGVVYFIKNTPYDDTGVLKESYGAKRAAAPQNYSLAAMKAYGNLKFQDKNESDANWQNTLQVLLDDNLVFEKVDEQFIYWNLEGERFAITTITQIPQSFTLKVGTKTCNSHTLRFALEYRRTEAAMVVWRNAVYERISQAPVATDSTPVIDSRMTAYEEALNKIEPPLLNELFGGRSSDANATIVRNELKRECISLIAKEFDTISSDDLISNVDAMGRYDVVQMTGGAAAGISFPTFGFVRGTPQSRATYARYYDKPDGPATYPAIDLAKAAAKGRYVQFLEQAFEWEHLSQVFYPYFWATPSRWVELMAREDIADPLFTDFLRAGSARVLLAVRPGYENAVLHFLATREPWDGGPSPVIGDPLYVPLYEEIRGQQDTFAGSEPVGEPWVFSLPTSLVYLESANNPLTNEYTEPQT